MSAEKVIGFDMDGVLLDQCGVMLEWVKQKHFAKLCERGWGSPDNDSVVHWELDKWMGVPKEEVAEYWKEAPKLACRAILGGPHYVKRFKDAGWKVVVISHRVPDSPLAARGRQDMKNWYGDLVDELVYTATTDGKLEPIKEKGCVAFLEDKYDTAVMIGNAFNQEHNIKKSYLINRHYNQSLDLNVPFKRIYSLEEYCQEFGV